MRKGLGRHNRRSAGGLIPSLVLDFAGTGTLDPRVTFTRSTIGTYYNSSGVLSTAAINAPRFDYNPSTLAPLGLLIEQSSTNLLTYSQTIDTTNWLAYNIIYGTTTIDTVAPDGTISASTINDTSTIGYYGVNKTVNLSASTSYTLSCYVKQGSSSAGFCIWLIGNNSTIFQQTIAWTAGIPTATGWTATAVGNGWYRVSYPFSSSTNTTMTIYLLGAMQLTSATGSTIFWGAQLEALAFPTSYIPTTSAQVTRAADIPPLPISTWYNTSQGTWFAQVNMLSTAGTPRIVGATPSSKAPMEISNQSAAMFDNVFGVSTANTITANTTQKIATAWTGTTGQVCLNGGTVATGSQTNGYANLSTIGIGYNSTSSDNFINGRIAKITYYPQALTSAQLQALTGP